MPEKPRAPRPSMEQSSSPQGFVRSSASPGRLARDKFELNPSRAAYNRPSGLLRGKAYDAHLNLVARYLPDLERHLDLPEFNPVQANAPIRTHETPEFWSEWDKFIQQVPDETLDDWESTAGFTTRSGTFIPREEAPGTIGSGESILAHAREKGRDPSRQKQIARAESVEPEHSRRRQLRARLAQAGMSRMREERVALESLNRSINSEQAVARIQSLTRRMGRLGTLAKRAGLMGIAGTIGASAGIGKVMDRMGSSVEEAYGLE